MTKATHEPIEIDDGTRHIRFEGKDKGYSFPYISLRMMTDEPENQSDVGKVTLDFDKATVTVSGKRLGEFVTSVHREEVRSVSFGASSDPDGIEISGIAVTVHDREE